MAKKDVVEYVCSSCGATTNTWSGKCYSCGEWNTLEEQITTSQVGNIVRKGAPLKPSAVGRAVNSSELRLLTGIKEYDSVMGGGIVTGSVNLIAGQPGIGKSTLLLQVAYTLASKVSVLYVSGEESVHQIGLRAQRLGIEQHGGEAV
jgi:DNA repair protein RadA/Sms